MKVFVFLVAVLAVALADDEKYTTKYDNIDLDEILHNDRLIKNYFSCTMDNGPCTPDGEVLKGNIKDALENNCSKCSEKQRAGVEKVLKYLGEEKPEMMKQLTEKYDPQGIYRTKYQSEAKEHNIKIE